MKQVKLLLSGIMLAVVSVYLLFVNISPAFSLLGMLAAIVIFVAGLLSGNEKDAESENRENLPQKKCPNCSKEHDFDYPKCPFCGHEY